MLRTVGAAIGAALMMFFMAEIAARLTTTVAAAPSNQTITVPANR